MKKLTKIYVGTVLLCFSFIINLSAQSIQYVSGFVRDATTHAELSGVTVLVKGTTDGGITSTNGHFSIATTRAFPMTLSFALPGYYGQLEFVSAQSVPVNVWLTSLTPLVQSPGKVTVPFLAVGEQR